MLLCVPWLSVPTAHFLLNASASRERSVPCRLGPITLYAPGVTDALSDARFSPVLHPIRSRRAQAAASHVHGNDDPKRFRI